MKCLLKQLTNVTSMIDIFLITQMIAANPETQKLCAAAVGIPYASNYTVDEWRQFQRCMTFFERQQKRPEAPASAPATPLPVLVIDTLFAPLPDA